MHFICTGAPYNGRCECMTRENIKENGYERNFKEDFLKDFLGELSNSSSRSRTHDCFGELPSNSPWRVV